MSGPSVQVDQGGSPPVGGKRDAFQKLLFCLYAISACRQYLIEPVKNEGTLEGYRFFARANCHPMPCGRRPSLPKPPLFRFLRLRLGRNFGRSFFRLCGRLIGFRCVLGPDVARSILCCGKILKRHVVFFLIFRKIFLSLKV